MIANRILEVIVVVLAGITIPLQIVTTFVLGVLVNLSCGLVFVPISLIWMAFFFPLLAASWLCHKIEILRVPVGLIGIPWAVLAAEFVVLMPSMGELEWRAAKLILPASWPFSWECWQFQRGRLDLGEPEARSLRQVLERISDGNALMQRTIDRFIRREQLDPHL